MNNDIPTLRSQLKQLAALHQARALRDEAYAQSKAELERRLIDAVLNAPATPTTLADASTSMPAPAASPLANTRPSRKLLAGLSVFVLLVGAAGYALIGSPAAWREGGAASLSGTEGSPDKAIPHALNFDQVNAMADKLATRLKDQPDDADGWAMLARSYAVTNRHAEALPAFRKALALRKDDPVLLGDFADALAVTQGRRLDGEPIKLVNQALKLAPDNLKALSLAGTAAFDRKDYATAIRHWERLLQVAPSDSPFVQQVQGGIEEARQLAGGKLPASVESKGSLAAAIGPATVSGKVSLSPALAAQASPEDTVFVFARATEGSRMPLAILKKQVKDLPLDFKLDDSLAMSPAAALSSAVSVVVGARVSKSGNAMPQRGDLQGQSKAVAVGSTGLRIEIAEVVGK